MVQNILLLSVLSHLIETHFIFLFFFFWAVIVKEIDPIIYLEMSSSQVDWFRFADDKQEIILWLFSSSDPSSTRLELSWPLQVPLNLID